MHMNVHTHKPTAKQRAVLRYLQRKNVPSYSAIAAALGISKSNVFLRVKALKRKGLA